MHTGILRLSRIQSTTAQLGRDALQLLWGRAFTSFKSVEAGFGHLLVLVRSDAAYTDATDDLSAHHDGQPAGNRCGDRYAQKRYSTFVDRIFHGPSRATEHRGASCFLYRDHRARTLRIVHALEVDQGPMVVDDGNGHVPVVS